MKIKNINGGFAPLLVIAIIAVLAVGGGAYAVKKNKEAKQVALQDNLDTQASANADARANANANLGVNANANAKGSIRSLLSLGKNSVCTFSTAKDGVSTSGTVWISVEGDMRGDFKTVSSASGTTNSSILVKDDMSYVWSGSQGAKMDISEYSATASGSAQAKQYVDLDSQIDYECSNWVLDESKFTLPTGVNFVDVEAMLKGSLKGGVTLPKAN